MHAGLLRPDGSQSRAWPELLAVRDELSVLAQENITTTQASVALMFDYSAIWACQIQPHAADFDALELHLSWYSALRRLGLDVDIVPPTAALDGYAMVVMPCQVIADEALAQRLETARASGSRLIIGARSGSRTPDFQMPANLAPGPLTPLAGVTVDQVDGLRPGARPRLTLPGSPQGHALRWREQLDEKRLKARVVRRFEDGMPAVTDHQGVTYLTAWLDEDSMVAIFAEASRAIDMATTVLPEGVRLRRRGTLCFAFNYAPEPRHLPDHLIPESGYLVGDATLPPAGVSVWSIAH
jgi:beta-galactosidase